jgi:SAM-dependent methyltransferase
MTDWNQRSFRGTWNRYPFTDVVSFVLGRYGSAPDRSKVSVLDLGCGGGSHLMFLAAEGFDFHGVDGNAESVMRANERLRGAGHAADRALVADFLRLPYDAGRFDVVIDRGALTCNRGTELPALIAEIYRVMKPGAAIFSMLLHESSASAAGGRDAGGNDYVDFPGDLSGAGLLHFTNAEEAQRLFSTFTIDSIERQATMADIPGRDRSVLAAWTVVVARK